MEGTRSTTTRLWPGPLKSPSLRSHVNALSFKCDSLMPD